MSDTTEVKRMSTRSKGEVSSTSSRISPRKKNVVVGAGAVRSFNLEKAKDGSLIYRRRASNGNNSTQSSSPAPDPDQGSADATHSAPAESRIHKRMRTIHKNSAGEEVESDAFCWLCHKEGNGVCCELCPRMYHLKCLNIEHISNDWVCPECEKILQAECVDTRSRAMSMITVDQFCVLLKYALQRMKHTDSADFHKPVDLNEIPHYTDYIHTPMDLTTLEKNIRKKMYGSTEAFLADAKYILHNCIIFNGERNKLTSNAKMVLKICKHEMNEIEICPDCYMNSCTKQQENWFCEPCRYPHTLVWAKMKGYPYWPAKALRVVNGQVDVRFFGEHDRAWVPVGQVFLLSKDPPVSIKKGRGGYDLSMEELKVHIERLKARFGSFEYAPNKMLYDPYAHIKASEDGGKATPVKSSTKSPNSTPTSSKSRSPGGSSVNLRSNTPKTPEKSTSIVSRTASAVKLKYSSIISTRQTKLKGQTIGDNVIVQTADNDNKDGNQGHKRAASTEDVKSSQVDEGEPTSKKAKLDTGVCSGSKRREQQKLAEESSSPTKSENRAESEQCDSSDDHKKVNSSISSDPELKLDKNKVEKKKANKDSNEDDEMGVQDEVENGDTKVKKVFLLNEDMIEKTNPKQNICTFLNVVPKTKLPDKKLIDEIENKIKQIQDKDDDSGQNQDVDMEESSPDKPNKLHEADKHVAVETEDSQPECSKSSATEMQEKVQETKKKNAFLEKLVASCKEKLGVGKTQFEEKNFVETESMGSSTDQSTPEMSSDDGSILDGDQSIEATKSPAASSTQSMEVSDSSHMKSAQDKEDCQSQSPSQKVNALKASDKQAEKLDTSPALDKPSEQHSNTASKATAQESPQNKTGHVNTVEDLAVTEFSPGKMLDNISSETPDKHVSSKVKDTEDKQVSGRTGEVSPGQKASPGTVKIKPQSVHSSKPQTATVLPEKVSPMPKLQNNVPSCNETDSSSLSKQQENNSVNASSIDIDFTGLDLSKYTNKVMKTVQSTLHELCTDMVQTEAGSAFREHLQLEVRRLEWKHQQDLNEIKHTANLKLLELRAAMELEKEKAIDSVIREMKYKFEAEKKQAIEETKKKQWCANCGKEAIFYCCWNTSYCDYPCQQAHWPQHMSSCTQSQNNQQSHDSRSSQPDAAANSTTINVETWQSPETQTNRAIPQTGNIVQNQPHNIQYIRTPQRIPATQVGSSVLRYIQPNTANTAQHFQANNPQQFQIGAMSQLNQCQPPLIMVSTGPTHQGQLRPVISHNTTGAQSVLLTQAGRLPPSMMQDPGLPFRRDF